MVNMIEKSEPVVTAEKDEETEKSDEKSGEKTPVESTKPGQATGLSFDSFDNIVIYFANKVLLTIIRSRSSVYKQLF